MPAERVSWMQVVVGVFSVVGACGGGGKDAPAPSIAPKVEVACVPAGAPISPAAIALTGSTFSFCLAADVKHPYCFTADLDTKTLARAPVPAPAGGGTRTFMLSEGSPTAASIEPSTRGPGVTVCTANKQTCHELPIPAASIDDRPIAVSEDATLVAVDTRSYRQTDARTSPGRLETWDAVTAKKLASFDIHYGPDHLGMEEVRRKGLLAFVGHTVLAFTEPGCALPCSAATIYSARGDSLGMFAADPTGASVEHFHDDLYVIDVYGPPGPFVVQDFATGKTTELDAEVTWGMGAVVVTPDRIVRVVGGSAPRVDVWGPDLKRLIEIAVPACAAGGTTTASDSGCTSSSCRSASRG